MTDTALKSNNSTVNGSSNSTVSHAAFAPSLKDAVRSAPAEITVSVATKTKKILLIDDDFGVCLVTTEALPEYLKRSEFSIKAEVTAPSSLNEVYEELKNTRYDLILLDGNLTAFGTFVRGPDIGRQILDGVYPLNQNVPIVDISSGVENKKALGDSIIVISKTRMQEPESLKVMADIFRKGETVAVGQSTVA